MEIINYDQERNIIQELVKQKKYEKCLSHCSRKLKKMNQNTKDDDERYFLYTLFGNMGKSYNGLGNVNKGLLFICKSIEYADIDNQIIAKWVLANMYKQHDIHKAEELYDECINYYLDEQDELSFAMVLCNKARMLKDELSTKRVINIYKKHEKNMKNYNKHIDNVRENLIEIYVYYNRLEEARKQLKLIYSTSLKAKLIHKFNLVEAAGQFLYIS